MRRFKNPEIIKGSPFRFKRLIQAQSLILDFSAPLVSALDYRDKREPSLKLDLSGERFLTRTIEVS